MRGNIYEYEHYKMSPHIPSFILYDVQAIKDLMKSHIFEYVYEYGEIPASDKDPYMHEMLIRYSNGVFSDEERQINADSSITEADMTAFAKNILDKYYSD